MMFVSYAQNFEDVLLHRAFRDVAHGFYIDVGAAHPDIDSVTRAFYDRGWHGINVEPVPEYHARLCAARPRDINLRLAVGEAEAAGTVYVVPGTGLSTTDAALAGQHERNAFEVRARDVQVRTLAEICRQHAPPAIHFLKIDVEGSEKAALAGADFTIFRPRVVLVEATAPGTTVPTHDEWEPILLAADYEFLWFDGLNRFYAAREHHDELAPHFRVPVCVFDNFLRAADTEWTRRLAEAETLASSLLERIRAAEAHARAAAQQAHDAELRVQRAEPRARAAEARAQGAERRADVAERRLLQTEALLAAEVAEKRHLLATLRRLEDEAASVRNSTSWRMTAPLRGSFRLARAAVASRPRLEAPISFAMPAPVVLREPPAPPHVVEHRTPRVAATRAALPARSAVPAVRAAHQFHSGSAVGDAITNAMMLIRIQLRAAGYHSEIYVEHLDPELGGDIRTIDELPMVDDYVLILHLSMGFDAYHRILALPAPKVLLYHNITPVSLFEGQPSLQRYARLGREQLAGLRGHVAAALADSDYNAVELRTLGFEEPQACTLLFDLDALRRRRKAIQQHGDERPFTLLFVGRIAAPKGQLDLVEAFARFRAIDARPSRLVLVGRDDGAGQDYAQRLRARVLALGLETCVDVTGLVTDAELRAHYDASDLYVSLSRHEGFGVPLVEAASTGIPVLAWPAGAVAFTLGGEAGLLTTREPDAVAARIAELAADPQARSALARAQNDALTRFELSTQMKILMPALGRAGLSPPPDPDVEPMLARNLRFTVAGHVNGSYSLAIINRALVGALEHARPGAVRLLPVEGEPTDRLEGVPGHEIASLRALAARPPHETGPVVVISQHHPIHVPAERGDTLLAYVFWEESLLPAATVRALNESFRSVLAPSQFIAKALLDSGVSVPVHVVGFAPELDRFARLPGAGARRAGSPTTFLHVSSAFPRKGVDALLGAYARAFRARDPVRLVIKTFPNPHNDAAAQIEALRRADPHAPSVELIDRDLDADDMAGLLREADAMVLPSRGEGFNLPAAEAMASGVPLIVTGYGGHMDFCNDANSRLVRFSLAPSRSHLATKMSLWADPDEHDLADALREAHEDRAASLVRLERARAASAEVFASARFVNRIEAASVRTLLQPASRKLRICVVSSWSVRCGVADYTGYLIEAMACAPDSEIVVLADTRAEERDVAGRPPRVRPVWSLNGPDTAERLRVAAASEDPDVVLIQHQPGLFDWPTLSRSVAALAIPGRVVAVTLHNTASLSDLDAAEQNEVVAGLQAAARLIVHTLADVERLRGLGLLANVVLIPQGTAESASASPERTLLQSDTVTVGSCGFMLPGKGLPALVKAVSILKPQWPGLRLRLNNADYGGAASREEAAVVRDTIQAHSLEDSVQLNTDFLPLHDMRWRLGQCDVLVLPYPDSKEGASSALRMALSTGPCLAVTPINFFDEAEDAVWRLPGIDPASIAQGLDDLLMDQDARSATRQAARAWLAERGWLGVAARTLGMLRGLKCSAV